MLVSLTLTMIFIKTSYKVTEETENLKRPVIIKDIEDC